MKLKEIKNNWDEILAVLVVEPSPSNLDIDSVIRLISTYGVIIWKQTPMTLKEYYHWQTQLGYHQYGHIWCNHKLYPIFDRVTNKIIDGKNTGLFGKGYIDWHIDQLFTPDAEELLSLFGVTTPQGAITQFANSIPYWKSKNKQTRNNWQQLQIAITEKTKETYEKKCPHYKLPANQQDDFNKRRNSRDIRKSFNFPTEFYHLYSTPRYDRGSLRRFVPNHPLGTKGIYFPHFNISFVTDSKGVKLPNSKEFYTKIKTEYIESGRYVYTHRWNKGDIALSDQLVTVHRQKDALEKSLIKKPVFRELYKSNCWYKTQYRKHFQSAL